MNKGVVLLLAAALLAAGSLAGRVVRGAEPDGGGLSAIGEVLELIRGEFAGKVNGADLVRGAIRGMLETLNDPYSYYMDPDEMKRFTEDLEGVFGGIGITVESREGEVTVVSILPATPAEAAGLQPGDRLVAVDGESLREAAVEKAVRLIRGKPGTEVRLTVLREGTGQLEVRLKRAEIHLPSVDVRTLDGNIGYIKVSTFGSDTGQQFRYIYDRLVNFGAKGIIVDLRNNSGGYLDQAVEVSQVLVPRGTIVHVLQIKSNGKTTIDTVPHAPGPPLVVLVNGGSASAAEIVAGAVKDNRAGTLVGTRTFGKGSVQTIYRLESGGSVRLTIAKYQTPGGHSIDGVGLDPDVVIEEADPAYQGPSFTALGTRLPRSGQVGLDVLGLQQRLNFLGYAAGPEDGIYGSRTLAALRAFQRQHGLEVRTAAGPKTLSTLERVVKERIAQRRKAGGDLPLNRAFEILRAGGTGAATSAK